VVSVGGSVRVDGTVEGDVVAVGGGVRLGPEAVVDGEVTSVGGTIDRDPGAVVHGKVNEVAFAPHMSWDEDWGPGPFFAGVTGLIGTIVWIAVLILLVCLAYLLARRPIERMEYRVGTSAWKAALVGLVAQLLFVPALVLTCVVLAISIIGIPFLLLVPFAILALVIGSLLGYTAVAKHLGHVAESRFGWHHASPYISLLIGVGLIMLLSFFGHALGVAGGPLKLFGTVLTILGFIAQYVAWTIGLGVLLLTRFHPLPVGRRRDARARPGAPAARHRDLRPARSSASPRRLSRNKAPPRLVYCGRGGAIIMRNSRTIFELVVVLALAAAAPAGLQGQAQAPTYRVILYLAEEGAPQQVQIQRLDEVWSEADGAQRLQSLLDSGAVRQLEEVTLVPGQEPPTIRFGDVTFRVRGVLKEPRMDSMFLRLEVDGGREALVKEMIAGFDETIVLAYPLAEGNSSVVALLVPVP
jgi:hypothetical protein